jgi:ubiquinone/menaquinone biosynthesis C-methylase UbiE
MDLAPSIPGAYRSIIPEVTWDGTSIPLLDDSVDCAIATEVLEHSSQPATVLAETRRVLRPDGFLFLTVPFLWPLHDVPFDQYRFTPFALERLLKDAGFMDIVIRPSGGWDASLAQMLGLWAVRRPMSARARRVAKRVLFPVVRRLIAMDKLPDLSSSPMIPGMSATARKP